MQTEKFRKTNPGFELLDPNYLCSRFWGNYPFCFSTNQWSADTQAIKQVDNLFLQGSSLREREQDGLYISWFQDLTCIRACGPYGNFMEFNSILNFWPCCTPFSLFLRSPVDRARKTTIMLKIWRCNQTVFIKCYGDKNLCTQKMVNFYRRIAVFIP